MNAITKMLSVSTKHISKETSDWLGSQCLLNAQVPTAYETGGVYAGATFYGWTCYCHDDCLEEYPQDLVAVWEYARSKDCDWVNLDCDGEQHSQLEEYEW